MAEFSLFGEVIMVKLIGPGAFIFYETRKDAENALEVSKERSHSLLIPEITKISNLILAYMIIWLDTVIYLYLIVEMLKCSDLILIEKLNIFITIYWI